MSHKLSVCVRVCVCVSNVFSAFFFVRWLLMLLRLSSCSACAPRVEHFVCVLSSCLSSPLYLFALFRLALLASLKLAAVSLSQLSLCLLMLVVAVFALLLLLLLLQDNCRHARVFVVNLVSSKCVLPCSCNGISIAKSERVREREQRRERAAELQSVGA